jgi:hypothetical protein
MKRLTILATALALVALGSACNKDAKDGAGTAGSASATGATGAAASAGGTAKESVPVESGVKFTKKSPAVGAKRTEDMKSEMAMKLTMAGKVNEMQMTEVSKKEEEILEFSNNAIMKIKVTYAEDAKSMTEAGKPAKAKASPLAGKTYVVASKDGKLTVMNDKDKPAPKPEATLVEKQYKSLGKPDPMLLAMPDRALKEGDDVPELSEALTKALKEHDEKTNVEGAKITFKKKDGDSGIFDVALTIKNGEGPFKMSVPLAGTLALRIADAWPTTMELSGPLTFELSEKDKKAGVEGGGTLKISSTHSYK